MWNEQSWLMELTLASRDEMGRRMLLEWEAVRGRFLIDTANSWYGRKPAPTLAAASVAFAHNVAAPFSSAASCFRALCPVSTSAFLLFRFQKELS
jgi:hypothetical protein